MMIRWRIVCGSSVLVLLTVGGLLSIYQMLFALWMTAYPYANESVWRSRFYMRMATTILIGLLWIAQSAWLYRRRRQGR